MADRENSYPLSEKTLKKIATSILKPIRQGESVTTMWVPMAGRRVVTKFTLEKKEFLKKILPDYQEYLLVYVEPLELTEETAQGYFRLLGKSLGECCLQKKRCQKLAIEESLKIFDKESLGYSKLLKEIFSLVKRITESGFKIVFFLGEFDELNFADTVFYNNLKLLWLKFLPSVQFVFLNREEIATDEKISKFGDLNEVLLQNVLYIPIFREEMDYLISRITSRFERDFSQEEKELLKNLCGPHPYMIKVASRFISRFNGKKIELKKIEDQLLNHFEMNAVGRGILEVQTKKSKEVLKKLAQGDQNISSLEGSILDRLGLIYKNNTGQWKIFGKIFKNVCLAKKGLAFRGKKEGGLVFEPKVGAILFQGRPIEEKFTTQEYNVLTSFLKESDVLKTRDNIGEVLWGEESYEKYSNWAIDQLISKLRKKLKKIGAKGKIITVRGRGYKLTRS